MIKTVTKLGALASALTLLLSGCGQSTGSDPIAQVQEPTRPNILFIMTDDHAQRAISAYGSDLIDTPNIDRLAEEGMRFDNAFVSNSICGPSRAAMMTGKHSHINGFIDNSHGRKFDSSQQTFPELLQKAGYETSIFGKWHLGSEPKGFDNWKILIGQGEYYSPQFQSKEGISVYEGEYVTNLTTDFVLDALKNRDKSKPFAMLYHQKAPHRNWMPDTELLKNGGMAKSYPLPENFYDDYVGRRAAANQDMQIAGMYLGWDMKLKPEDYEQETTTGGYRLDPSLINYDAIKEKYLAMYNRMTDEQKAIWDEYYKELPAQYHALKDDEKALAEWKFNRYLHDYLATVKSVDDNIGRVLKYLDDNGLADNTIVVYTSDQGFYLGEHGWFDKRFMYEESMSTPLIIRYPQMVKPNQVSQRLVQNIDFAPTFLDLAGFEIPAAIQGESIKPLLNGEVKTALASGERDNWRTGLYYQYFEYPVPHAVMPHYGVRTETHKLIRFQVEGEAPFYEMYDLLSDPSEQNNIYGQKEYAELQQSLHKELDNMRVKYEVPEDLSHLKLVAH